MRVMIPIHQLFLVASRYPKSSFCSTFYTSLETSIRCVCNGNTQRNLETNNLKNLITARPRNYKHNESLSNTKCLLEIRSIRLPKISSYTYTRSERSLHICSNINLGIFNSNDVTRRGSSPCYRSTRCQVFENRSEHLHTGIIFPTWGSSKKKRRPVIISKKSKSEVVNVWKDMTVKQLAVAVGTDIDTVLEIFTYLPDTDQHHWTGSTKVINMAVIKETVRKTGKRSMIIGPPDAVKPTVKNRDAFRRPPADPNKLVSRPPVVTIMGHVDHGKTTLLDTLRNSSVVDTEFGGITQHIGAFKFSLPDGSPVTVLDTPGHAAFSSMRSRGAHVTDIAVLVVAADDGVMQQTRECIAHAHTAGVPIVVAINKIDKIDANVPRTRLSLLEAGVMLEGHGGEVQAIEISAKLGTNVDLLVEAILAEAEMLALTADPSGLVEASVLEANTDVKLGKTATVLVQRGLLKPGAFLVAGTAWARVRLLLDEHGNNLDFAAPATPVQVLGWRTLPSVGDVVLEVDNSKRAAEVMEWRNTQLKQAQMEKDRSVVEAKVAEHNVVYKEQLEEKLLLGFRYKMRRKTPREKEIQVTVEDEAPKVSLVLKCDVDGSLEVLLQVLATYHSQDVALIVIASGVGAVTPSDVNLAHTFGGSVYTFNLVTDQSTRELANELGVKIVATNIIYRLVEEICDEVTAKMPPVMEEEIIGEARVLEEFVVNEGRQRVPVAGCRCIKGTLKRKEKFRLIRDDGDMDAPPLHEGLLSSMRHVKAEVDSIGKDKECGLRFIDQDVRFRPGDRIICYTVHMRPQSCKWVPPGF